MPVVNVKYRYIVVGDKRDLFVSKEILFPLLAEALPGIIAAGLNVPGNPGAHLTPDDVEIGFRTEGKYDVGKKHIEIVVFANNYPERAADLQSARIPKMQKEIRKRLDAAGFSELTVSLYVHLGIGGFAEF